jgi:AcrR family transcriptional regulator
MRPAAVIQRKKILDAAADNFAAEGFSGARVDDIAASAGVNKRLLYHYVGAKSELLRAVLIREAQQLDATKLTSRRLWALVLAEATHTDSTQLLRSVLEFAQREAGGNVSERLAWSMFTALLPAGSALVAQLSGPDDGPRKPRIRMMPQVVEAEGSQRSSAKRLK